MAGSDDTGEDNPSDGLASPVGSGDWAELRREVFDAAMMRKFCGPDEPLVKIGRFDGLRWIGEGGYGVVFKAIDPELDRLVALKLCRRRSESLNAAIKAEARALAKLDHPHIVAVFEPGEHVGWAFFAMQYIEGYDAHEFGRREPRPSWREVVDVYRRVARALAFAHEKGLTHGDIKPSNILIDRRGWPFLADFGLAQIVVRNTPESERDGLRRLAGTLVYMAPEVLDGGHGDERSDQFSLCVAILHTLLGTAPFSGDTSGEVLADIVESLEETFERVEAVTLREVLRKGLAIDPLERFASVDELADALDRLVEPVPSMSSPEFEPEPQHEGEPESADGSESTTPESDAASTSVGEPESPMQPVPQAVGEELFDENAPSEPDELTPQPEPAAVGEAESPPVSLGDEEVVLLRVGPATTPTSEPKRRSFASFLLLSLVCVTLGWVSRGRVEVARVSEPIPQIPREAPSPCALEESNPTVTTSDVLIITCSRIRAGDILGAGQLWKTEFITRRYPPPGAAKLTDDELTVLRAQTLIVARTIDEQAERYHRWAWLTSSIGWTAKVLGWPTPEDPAVSSAALANEVRTLLELPVPEDPNPKPEGQGREDRDPQSIRERNQ
jgi:serine/threonine protein kinase